MQFKLTRQQEMVRQLARKFAERDLMPVAAELDEQARYPQETLTKAGALGFMGMPIPREYGGGGTDFVSHVIAMEEISNACGATGVIVQTHVGLCCWPILTFGTEEQKQNYLPDLATGRKKGAFALTEANAGTDAAGMQTTAEDKGDHWLINGSKIFISGGGIADVYVVIALTDRSKGTKGMSAFIIEKGTPGLLAPNKENQLGIRASVMTELLFDDVKLPKEALLGKAGQGFKLAMAALDVGRIGIAAQALGIAQGAFNCTVEYMKNRKQFGKPLYKFQALAFEMAEMQTRIEAARLLLYMAADARDQGLPPAIPAARAKLFCSETAMYVTTKAVQFHGGYGYTKDYPVERMMRDAKITEIYEGTSEVMKMLISGDIFS